MMNPVLSMRWNSSQITGKDGALLFVTAPKLQMLRLNCTSGKQEWEDIPFITEKVKSKILS